MSWKPSLYAGWGRALRAEGEIARPATRAEAAHLAPEGPALGARRSYGDAALRDGGRALDMTRLDRVLAFDPATGEIEVEAGVPIGEIAAVFARRGWLPAVMPGTGFATVGGCIAQDVHGKNHHRAGAFGQHVAALRLALPSGETVETKPGDALFQASCGGLGQTGAILSARLRLAPTPGDCVTVTERRVRDWEEHLARLDASPASHVVGWLDATATGRGLGRGIVEEGELARGLARGPSRALRVPLDAPAAALSAPVVHAFNWAYFRRVPARGRSLVKPLAAFFFPLDRIHDWNRLYGRRGFHQFQCVVPLGAAGALRGMLAEIAAAGLASPLAVLKRMGPGRAGHLSFPMEGYTLAVDLPERAETRALAARLEARTIETGGRLYFAKDSLAGPAAARAMYPELPQWRAVVNRIDPERRLETSLVRRLGLRAD